MSAEETMTTRTGVGLDSAVIGRKGGTERAVFHVATTIVTPRIKSLTWMKTTVTGGIRANTTCRETITNPT